MWSMQHSYQNWLCFRQTNVDKNTFNIKPKKIKPKKMNHTSVKECLLEQRRRVSIFKIYFMLSLPSPGRLLRKNCAFNVALKHTS